MLRSRFVECVDQGLLSSLSGRGKAALNPKF